jgi:hypothetical protein
MGSWDVAAIRRVPCRVAVGCTDLTAAWPHGGTGIGVVREPFLQRYSGAWPVTIEAFGGVPVEYLEAGEAWGIGGVLRTLDDDALAKAFPNTAAGTVTQRRMVTAGPTQTVRAGNWMSGRSFTCVLTPEGATHAKSASTPDVDAPMVVLYRCMPVMGDPFKIDFTRQRDVAIPFAWMGIPDSSSRTMRMGRRADLALVFP